MESILTGFGGQTTPGGQIDSVTRFEPKPYKNLQRYFSQNPPEISKIMKYEWYAIFRLVRALRNIKGCILGPLNLSKAN